MHHLLVNVCVRPRFVVDRRLDCVVVLIDAVVRSGRIVIVRATDCNFRQRAT